VISAVGDRVLFDPQAPAAAVLAYTMDSVLPVIQVTTPAPDGETWTPRRDLLGSGSSASLFVAEVDDDGGTTLRFGGGAGQTPGAGTSPSVLYRVGNGSAGNLGADTTFATLIPSSDTTWNVTGMILGARNPLAALGGTDPETVTSVQINAPGGTRVQMRAVTELDHAAVLLQNPAVKQALAVRRFNGSFYTVVVSAQPAGALPADPTLREAFLASFVASMRAYVEPYRLAGWDIQIVGPSYVALDVMLTLQVAPNAFRSSVLASLQQVLGTGTLPPGLPAFFCPDRFGFGETIYFSQVVAVAMQVAGVQWVDVSAGATRFQRATNPVPYDPILNNAIAMRGAELPVLGSPVVFNLQGGL
jgi:predicted phage baseplate assembly protein